MTYPKTSPAAVLTAYGAPVEIQELDVPELEPQALLVEVEVSTMCGTDVHIYRGDLSGIARLPLVLGHEMVGRIVALGPARRSDAVGAPLAEGDLVVWSYAWCGACYWCTVSRQPTLCTSARLYGWGPVTEFPHLTGGFSRYAYVMPRCQVVHVPEGLDLPVVASGTCAFRTVIHGYDRLGRIEPMETVVIQGSGPVGLYALAHAVQAGSQQVICIGAPKTRLRVATRWGATEVIDIEQTGTEARRERVLELTDGRGADVVVECSGVSAALSEGMALLRNGGRYLVIGQADPTPALLKGTDFTTRQLSVYGVRSGDISHYYRAIEFMRAFGDRFPFGDLLGQRYGLSGVDAALSALGEARELKPVIVPILG